MMAIGLSAIDLIHFGFERLTYEDKKGDVVKLVIPKKEMNFDYRMYLSDFLMKLIYFT